MMNPRANDFGEDSGRKWSSDRIVIDDEIRRQEIRILVGVGHAALAQSDGGTERVQERRRQRRIPSAQVEHSAPRSEACYTRASHVNQLNRVIGQVWQVQIRWRVRCDGIKLNTIGGLQYSRRLIVGNEVWIIFSRRAHIAGIPPSRIFAIDCNIHDD